MLICLSRPNAGCGLSLTRLILACCLSKTKSMEDHKIEVIFRLNFSDLLEILSSCQVAMCYTFCRSNCTNLWSCSFNLRSPQLMRTALAGRACDLQVAGNDCAWLGGDWSPCLLFFVLPINSNFLPKSLFCFIYRRD